jgi:trehalose synthase
MADGDAGEIRWLEAHSMSTALAPLVRGAAGTGRMWQRPYGTPRPREAASAAPAWFTAYPASIVTAPGVSVLATLADPALLDALAGCGIRAVHTGPMKQAGGVVGTSFTPTVDGHFDRIGIGIDPVFGTIEELQALSTGLRSRGGMLIDDIIPGHTGKGPDFRLAERAVGDYPGLYHLVEIPAVDWHLLPEVLPGRDSANLTRAAVAALADRGHLVGLLPRTIFLEPGVKETDWSATSVVRGADGRDRRWVYLHYFKEGQPSLNWLDPSMAAARLIMGDALHALQVIGAVMLRLDANGFLGIERLADGTVVSEGHPLSVTANELLAGFIRKAGGFSFQELNLTVEDIAVMSRGGADLSYDFVTRPAVQHALLTGDASFLRLMHREARRCGVDPAALVHALQNHDELTIELVHFWTRHAGASFELSGARHTGTSLRQHIRDEMYARLVGDVAPLNRRFVDNGVACTMVSVAAAAVGVRDLRAVSAGDLESIRRAHLALAAANALQPGVFALSGWDLVGAVPLEESEVTALTADGDTRWINRGGYDLMGVDPAAARTGAGLPVARSLHGPLPAQLHDGRSFASRLAALLRAREATGLVGASLVDIVEVEQPGLLVLRHEAADGAELVCAVNLGGAPVSERIPIGSGRREAVDALTGRSLQRSAASLTIALETHAAALIRVS